ncbi:MAG: ATP-binding protein [Desulfobulbaceae bacterium]|nr:ATP-binding protein [Desulfobulbaceae bacterium]
MEITMLIGHIGSGKTTAASQTGILDILCADDLRETLGCIVDQEYYWTPETEEIVQSVMLDLFELYLIIGAKSLLLDGTFMTKKSRGSHIMLAKKYGYQIRAVVFEDEGMDTHVSRRMKSPRGLDKEYWEGVYLKHKEEYEPPTTEEGFYVIENDGNG